AGDILNVFQLDSEHIAFYLLDVVGKGVPAALLSVTLSRFLSPLAGSSLLESADSPGNFPSPSELATELNKRFPMDDDNQQNFTLLYGYYNPRTRELSFVSAGHPGPLYIPAEGQPEILDCDGFPVGIFPEPDYVDHTLVLQPGDRIVLYSDGLLDAENPHGAYFEKKGLLDWADQEHESLQDEMTTLHDRVTSFCNGHSQTDDISVLAMRVRQEP
ncbi:MAG: PP2C family protein-serine/threonine phosphatase, partial [Planctomycetota bacterium]